MADNRRLARRHYRDAVAMQRRLVLTALCIKAADLAQATGANPARIANLRAGWVDCTPGEAKAVGRLVARAAARVFAPQGVMKRYKGEGVVKRRRRARSEEAS